MTAEVIGTRRRIIRRPRLTKLLDENPARIKLLIAPAGYGKTTLAQQWLAQGRTSSWYRCGAAAADIAALSAGLSLAMAEIVEGAGQRMRARLHAAGHPEDDVPVLAELLAEDVSTWPEDAWIVVDDYQFATESAASEHFVKLLLDQTPVQLFVTTRRRPSWTNARRVLYGEIQEIDRRLLAMSKDEALATLGPQSASVSALLREAAGWPAVIGLAALSHANSLQAEPLPSALYEYFAEEVLTATDPATQDQLATLALAQSFDDELARILVGPASINAVHEGVRIGVLVPNADGGYHVHPLLGEFLEQQTRDTRGSRKEVASGVARALLNAGRIDEAFDLGARFGDGALMKEVLERSFDRLLKEGRVATLTRWLERMPAPYADEAVAYLAEAEAAYRQGHHVRARELADHAAARLGKNDPLRSRVFTRAGQSSLMTSREAEGLRYFELARDAATSPADVREALIGLYFASSELGLDSASEHLHDLNRLDDRSPETTLRIEAARLTHATRDGAIGDAIEHALPKLRLVSLAEDPFASTAFLHMLANALNLGARYDEAHGVVGTLLETAKRYRLEMPVPHALLNQALARQGRREYASAHAALNAVTKYIGPHGDPYLEFSVRSIRSRIFLSEGRKEEAVVEVTESADAISSPPLRAEYLATAGLSFALAGEPHRARHLAGEAERAFPRSVEAQVLGTCTTAILSSGQSKLFRETAQRAWAIANLTGNLDSLVCSYRAHPPLLKALLYTSGAGMRRLVSRVRDIPLARRLGVHVQSTAAQPLSGLTPRETEVVELLRSGLSNRAIAQALFVSEATVKVHLRHVYEKLGVRSRSEALARILTQ